MANHATIKLINTIDICKYMVTIFSLPKRSKLPISDFYLLCGASLLLIGCSTTQPPVQVVDRAKSDAVQPVKPVESNNADNQVYTVQKGDTLYGIALNHGVDFKKLTEWKILPIQIRSNRGKKFICRYRQKARNRHYSPYRSNRKR